MNDAKSYSYVSHYLAALKRGDFDSAFFGLIESSLDVLPELIEAFKLEKDVRVRASLVRIIWEFRRSDSIPFLKDALCDSEPAVWKEALNGLVTLASPESLKVCDSVLGMPFAKEKGRAEFCRWIEEAIAQIAHEIKRTNG